MRKLVLSIVIALALVGAAFAGWKLWSDSQRLSRLEEWRKEVQGQDEARRGEVIAALREELKADPGRSDARAVLGEALAFAGKMSDAAVELRSAAKTDPGDVHVRRVLAQVCLRLDLVDEAVKCLEEALVHVDEGERPAVELDLARVCMERYRGSAKDEDFRAARNYFQDARHHPATEAEAMDGYAMLWLMKGPNSDLDKGIATYRELLTKYPSYSRADKIRELLDNFDHPGEGAGKDAPPPDAKPPEAKPPEGKPREKSGDG